MSLVTTESLGYLALCVRALLDYKRQLETLQTAELDDGNLMAILIDSDLNLLGLHLRAHITETTIL